VVIFYPRNSGPITSEVPDQETIFSPQAWRRFLLSISDNLD
jgi:hypothetical protein